VILISVVHIAPTHQCREIACRHRSLPVRCSIVNCDNADTVVVTTIGCRRHHVADRRRWKKNDTGCAQQSVRCRRRRR